MPDDPAEQLHQLAKRFDELDPCRGRDFNGVDVLTLGSVCPDALREACRNATDAWLALVKQGLSLPWDIENRLALPWTYLVEPSIEPRKRIDGQHYQWCALTQQIGVAAEIDSPLLSDSWRLHRAAWQAGRRAGKVVRALLLREDTPVPKPPRGAQYRMPEGLSERWFEVTGEYIDRSRRFWEGLALNSYELAPGPWAAGFETELWRLLLPSLSAGVLKILAEHVGAKDADGHGPEDVVFTINTTEKTVVASDGREAVRFRYGQSWLLLVKLARESGRTVASKILAEALDRGGMAGQGIDPKYAKRNLVKKLRNEGFADLASMIVHDTDEAELGGYAVRLKPDRLQITSD